MKKIHGGSFDGRPVSRRSFERVGLAVILGGMALVTGCWPGDIADLPILGEGGRDAGLAAGNGAVGCQWPVSTGTGCALANVSCDQLAACPASWALANSPSSCPQSGTSVHTDTCDGMSRWILVSNAFGSPGDGYLVATCYYDSSTGLLAGIDAQGQLPCGSNTFQFGTIPTWCHDDAGVAGQVFLCASSGSGGLLDGGVAPSCGDAASCGHGG